MLAPDRSWTRPSPTAEQVRTDVVIAVVAAVVSVASVQLWHSANGASTGWRGVEAYVWFGLAGLLLAGRRRLPLTVLLAESAVFIVIGERLQEFAAIFTIQIILFVSLYSAWAWSRQVRRLLATSAVVLLAMFGWLVWLFVTDAPPSGPRTGLISSASAIIIYSLVINVVYFFGAMAWGHLAWRSARQRAEIAEQSALEQSRQAAERERAVQNERVRIARDLHDVVAHHVSGIGVQAAGAGRVLSTRPDDARTALDRIEQSSRQAVEQMHQLVGLLRSDDGSDDQAASAPQPGLAQLHTLAADPAARPAVSFSQVGTPFAVAPTVETSLFRVAQEAVTNARRHARAHQVGVTLRYLDAAGERPSAVEVEVVDDGRAASGAGAPGTGGFGLSGIRERASMHAGSCDIGPRPQGGFRVRVTIPVRA